MFKPKESTKIIICIGTGGVGKTTISAALAMGISQQKKKTLVLTIDPSQRLAQALNFKPDGEVYSVTEYLDVTTLNHEKVFADFVLRAAQNSMRKEEVEKLLKNKLYNQLSTQLSGSQDFTSLYQLNYFKNLNKYDLIILDTPPAQHTWNFLKAPEKLAKLFNDDVAHWFRESDENKKSIFKTIMNFGTQQVLNSLEVLTGAEFINELKLFFLAIQKWQKPLEQQVLDCQKILSSSTTEFVLVTSLEASKLNEALKLSTEINKQGYNISSVIINKFPPIENLQNIKNLKIKNHLSYLTSLLNELTRLKSVFLKHLNLYKVNEVEQNRSYEQEFSDLFNSIEKIN